MAVEHTCRTRRDHLNFEVFKHDHDSNLPWYICVTHMGNTRVLPYHVPCY